MTIIINSPGGNPARVIQVCEPAKKACNKLKSRYAGQMMINMISIFNMLLNMKLRAGGNMGYHISSVESQMLRWTSIGSEIDECMKIALMIQFLSNLKEYALIITSMITMADRLATWNRVKMHLLEESKKLTNFQVNNNHDQDQPSTATLAVWRRPQANEKNGFESKMKFYNCNKTGHFAREYRARRHLYTDRRNIGNGKFPKNSRNGGPDR